MNVKQYKLTLFFGRHKNRSAGVWMYSTELLNALCELTQEEKEIKNMIFPMQIVFSGSDEQATELERIKLRYAELPISIVRLEDFKEHRRIGVVSDFFRRINNTKVIHATANVLPLFGKSKKIVTIHDLFQAYPINQSKGAYAVIRELIYKGLYFLQFNRAHSIVTDLSLVANDIKQKYNKFDNVFTILPGLKSIYTNSKLPDKDNKHPYLVSFASYDPRKNIRRVIDAFINAHFLEDIKLVVIASSADLKNELDYFLQSNEISNIEVLSQVPDVEMLEIYSKARALIFPSLAEGFGFPIYEALSQGIPVVASANLAIEQIRVEVRPFVIECDPFSSDSIGNAMLRAVSCVQRAEKRKKVAQYIRGALSFKNTALEFLELYSKYL